MAVAVQGATTAATTLLTNYQKTYTKAYSAINTWAKEWSWLKQLGEEDVTITPDSIYITLDLVNGGGVAMIPEGGRQARAATPALNQGTLNVVWANARFMLTGHAKAYDKKSKAAQTRQQLKHQVLKQAEAFGNRAAQQWYGFSTGVAAKAVSAASLTSGGTVSVTLSQGFGDSGITLASYLQRFFQVGEQIAVVNGTTLNAVGEILSTPTAGTGNIVVSCQWDRAVSLVSGNNIVFANNAYTDTLTLADHTDDSKWPNGMKDAIESTSLHGISGSTYAQHTAAVNNSSGGRFTVVKQSTMQIEIMNNSPYEMDNLLIADDVYRDVQDQMGALVRFADPTAMRFDAKVQFATKVRRSKFCPPGHVFGWASEACGKLLLTDVPSESGDGEMDKVQDFSRYTFSKDLGYGYVYRCRKALAEYRGLTGQ